MALTVSAVFDMRHTRVRPVSPIILLRGFDRNSLLEIMPGASVTLFPDRKGPWLVSAFGQLDESSSVPGLKGDLGVILTGSLADINAAWASHGLTQVRVLGTVYAWAQVTDAGALALTRHGLTTSVVVTPLAAPGVYRIADATSPNCFTGSFRDVMEWLRIAYGNTVPDFTPSPNI